MPTYRYLAKRGPQETTEGVLEAESRAQVLSHLAQLGYTPVRVDETSALKQGGSPLKVRDRKVPRRHFDLFTRQFASLVHSQVPLFRALKILREQTPHPQMRRILDSLEESIRQGQTLSEAMVKYPKAFSTLYVSLVRSGEVGGMLDTVLNRLAEQADREEALRSKVRGALVYPMFVGVVGAGTIAFLLTFVLPRLSTLFRNFQGELPLPTRMVVTLSQWMANGWFWAAAALGLVGISLLFRLQGSRGRLILDRFCLRLPLMGNLVRHLEIARFSRSFGLLLDHGIPILQATEVATPAVENRVIFQELKRLPAQLKEGNSLAQSLRGFWIATPFVVNTVAVGEESGKMGEAFTEVANFYEREIERLLNVLAGLLEPGMILVVGGIVGFIVMAVMLPIFEISLIVR